MALLALPAHLGKTGMLLPDHADAHLDKTGMEPSVSDASVEDNGTQFQENVPVLQETGMDSHAFNVPLDKLGMQQASHAHAQAVLSGTVSTAERAQAQPDTGIINSTIVFAEQETGTAHNALSAQPIPTGTERPASHVLAEDSGTHWI